jgi:hypothetical protein
VGIVFFIAGTLFGIARFKYGFKPDALDVNAFAVYSSYFETKFMQITRNNFGEEITGILIISGLFLFAFSKEKVENEQTNQIRLKAFFIAAYLNFIFLIASFLFTFGLAFVYMLMINMGIGLAAYIGTFRLFYFLDKKNRLPE